MSTQVALAATVAAGAVVALQAPVNARLADGVGTLPSAAVNFLVGTIALVLLVVVLRQTRDVRAVSSVPWYYVVGGGVFGAIYVTTVLVTVRGLGAGGVTAATLTGQLAASVVIDQFGLLGVAKQPITLAKIAGVLLLAAGVYLIVRE